MPNKIKPKRSYTSNSVPLTTDLETNELAINWADGKAFTKDANGQIVSVTLGGSGGSVDLSGLVANAGGVSAIKRLTQAQYDAIATPSADTLYVIVG